MKKIILLMIIVLFASCRENDDNDIKVFSLFSEAFKNNGKIPQKYTEKSASGRNVSIPLYWKKPPSGTKTFAILMIDRHPVANNFIHWLAVYIPEEVREIMEGASVVRMPDSTIEFVNSFGYKGYGGPSASAGTGVHEYMITIYALNADFIDEFSGKETGYVEYDAVKQVLEKYMIGKAELSGTYER